jgi:hypothetical protein
VIIIQDTTAPIWSTLATALDTTIECSDTEALTNAQSLIPIAKIIAMLMLQISLKVSGAFVPSSQCDNTGTYTNTWTVKTIVVTFQMCLLN